MGFPLAKNAAGVACGLRFRRIDVSARSALAAELAPDCRKGIYFYVFDDGTAYVGKSVDMVKRHAQHMHEYGHRADFRGVEIAKAYFASVDDETDADALDELETEAIRRAENGGFKLRNKLKCGRPGGDADAILDLSDERMLLLPWSRAARTDSLGPAVLPEATAGQVERFARLESLPEYDELIVALNRYARETMPEPAHTAGVYWAANAYPSRRRVPAACLTCGTLETLVVFADAERPFGYLNLKRPEGARVLPCWTFWRYGEAGYKAAGGVVTFSFHSARELARILEKPAFLEWAYRLNVECFRKCKNPLGGNGNPLLMKAILNM